MTLFDKATAELTELKKSIDHCRKYLASHPIGSLTCRKNGRYDKWYRQISDHDGERRSVYLPKSEHELAKQLALNSYYEKKLAILENEAAAVRRYLKKHDSSVDGRPVLSLMSPGIQELLAGSEAAAPDDHTGRSIKEWQEAAYTQNPFRPDLKNVTVTARLKVRSKSEAFIASALIENSIPFRYEAPLTLNESTYYPDFTIRHPVTGRFYYWEHLGLMDNPDYVYRALSKLRVYCTYDLIPMVNLIITTEASNTPLDLSLVNKLIEHFFLD